MKRWIVLTAVVVVAGCAGPQQWGTGLQVATFDKPYQVAEPATPAQEAGEPVKAPTRIEILKEISASKKNSDVLSRLVSAAGKVTPAAFWTGNTCLLGPSPEYVQSGVDWSKGITVTPKKPRYETGTGLWLLILDFSSAWLGSHSFASLEGHFQANTVGVNFPGSGCYKPKAPDSVSLCIGRMNIPTPMSPPTDPYTITIGIQPFFKQTAKGERLQDIVMTMDGKPIYFWVGVAHGPQAKLFAVVELSGGAHEIRLWAQPTAAFLIRYLKVTKL